MRTASRYLAVSSVVVALAIGVAGRTRPHYGGTLRVESQTPAAANSMLRAAVAETLVILDSRGAPQPSLALRWEAQNGERRWQFWIRPGVVFHDGTPLNAASVAEALAAAADRKFPWRSVRPLGDSVVFEADTPLPGLPAMLAAAKFAIARTASDGTLIGTGAYKVARVAQASQSLEAFDDHWSGRAFINTLEFTGSRSAHDQWMDLGVGRTDIVEVPPEVLRSAQQEHMRVALHPDGELIALTVNPRSQQLQDVVLRQAVAESIDRTALVNFIYQKQGDAAATLLPATMTGYSMLFPQARNLPRARELRGQRQVALSLVVVYDADDPALQLAAERIALNAREGGINIQALPRSNAALAHADLFVSRFAISSSNAASALADLSSQITGEPVVVGESIESIYQHEHELLSTYRVIPLLHLPRAFAASDRVRQWKLEPGGEPATGGLWLEERK
jgi:peptide/nickel transport system substrate-binding protein